MKVNRIFCIGRNYAEHIRELGNRGQTGISPEKSQSDPDFPVVFMKPASCVVPAGEPITLPRGRGSVHHEAELVVMLTGGPSTSRPSDATLRTGSQSEIPVEHALKHVAALTLGLDLTLRELQNELKRKGAPWELSKAFDFAAPLGDWVAYQGQDLQALEFACEVNGQRRQAGRTSDMLFPVAHLIHILSRTWSLRPGDIVFTGTPAGVGPLKAGDRVTLSSAAIGRFEWTCR